MKQLFFCIIIILAFIITCPDTQKHQEAIKTALAEKLDKRLGIDSSESPDLLSVFGSAVTANLTEAYLSSELRVNNYFLFSLGMITKQGEDKIISLGLLNHVFTFLEDESDR